MKPERMCAGCRQHFPKNMLIRVVRSPDGAVSVDETGKKPGRGAYVCKNPGCLKRVQKSHGIERGLKKHLTNEIYADLEKLTDDAAETSGD